MSQSQEAQKQPQHQKANMGCKNKKRKNGKKLFNGNTGESAVECYSKELANTAGGDNTSQIEKKPFDTSMVQLQTARKPTTPITSRSAAGANWEVVAKVQQKPGQDPATEQENVVGKDKDNQAKDTISKSARLRQKRRNADQKYLAMDCEMVGVGLNGQEDMLARVSIVNKRGEVLLDKFVKPQETVIDYRTSVSGIRPHDISNGVDFKSVQDEVVQMLQGKILVGHAIRNDLAVLHIKHPNSSIRDTSRYKPLRRLVANGHTPSLKRLSQAILGKEIQVGEHNSIEDARAAMSIYKCLATDWETHIKRHMQMEIK